MSTPSGEPREAERAEAALVHRYRDHLAIKGIAVGGRNTGPGRYGLCSAICGCKTGTL